ncbi:hypothetical protein DPMN_165670 [Dreissena polymorpha]|uniref:Uncharacterized protein n=1 Tax=Dreissena polymorpha TaxID=45954 RepID=A0A9D4EXM3_DREPO|nr:hypothetical protein DPMN_165670 [Dreissena polymorpha]
MEVKDRVVEFWEEDKSSFEIFETGREEKREARPMPTFPTAPTTQADRTRPVPDRLVGLDRVDLNGSGNPATVI